MNSYFQHDPAPAGTIRSLVLLLCFLLTAISAAFPQIPDRTAPQASEPVAAGETQTVFHHLIARRLWISGQVNFILQAHPDFSAPYSGPNSLRSNYEKASSRVLTLYAGLQVSNSTEILADAEQAGGRGLSDALGLAGFSNLDAVRNPSLGQDPYLARLMVHHVFALSKERVESEPGPFSTFTELPACRLDLRFGKFGTVDFFDVNSVGSDSHLQFMNWAVNQNGAYDFAADTRGYTWGVIVEYQQREWGFRFGEMLMPSVANGMDEIWNLRQARAENYELEFHRGPLPKRPGMIRLLGYTNHANMGIYREAINRYLAGLDTKPDITDHPFQTTRKYGLGINLEQALTRDLTSFGRFGWNNGKTESYAFTEIDQTFAGGLALNGRRWHRRYDRAGMAFASNALSGDHRRYLALGGKGFIIGDGTLNYGREKIVETYYTAHLWKGFYGSTGVQYVTNPAYNRDRGPVVIPTLRFHVEL
ncbi:MAG TPA: carbohydrate porin [Terriglobales bacterium]|nr:carbohydrate porin [Terriglobales bacterium]